jgi:hypothetical protein
MISDDDIRRRIRALNDTEDDSIATILRMGDNDNQEFLIAILVREYEGNEYVNERYVALSKHDESEDTWMKNGINRRVNSDTESLAQTLEEAYKRVRVLEDHAITAESQAEIYEV